MQIIYIIHVSHSVMSNSLQHYDLWPARLLCRWSSPGKNTGVGCHFLLQGTFPSQRSNLGLLHWRQILYHLIYQENPYIVYTKKYATNKDFFFNFVNYTVERTKYAPQAKQMPKGLVLMCSIYSECFSDLSMHTD